MWPELGTTAVIVLDAAVWLMLHALAVTFAMRIPWQRLNKDGPLTRLRPFEQDGRWYERWLKIHLWKDFLPDGGSWVKAGFAKRKLQARNRDYLQRFAAETRRGELTHWMLFLPLPIFIGWNNALGMLIMVIYCLIANIPCILVQRYNRARLLKVMSRGRRL
ncbi:glycosyl-4,4'-diaponeurosporenoate acyltransferase [Paenibacillaceae bacterium GAS479]|nr:glycosyl-4,4'-diaponeurosporenoate acyltransferase [Paenibacillaceae bacterium GAS479]